MDDMMQNSDGETLSVVHGEEGVVRLEATVRVPDKASGVMSSAINVESARLSHAISKILETLDPGSLEIPLEPGDGVEVYGFEANGSEAKLTVRANPEGDGSFLLEIYSPATEFTIVYQNVDLPGLQDLLNERPTIGEDEFANALGA